MGSMAVRTCLLKYEIDEGVWCSFLPEIWKNKGKGHKLETGSSSSSFLCVLKRALVALSHSCVAFDPT